MTKFSSYLTDEPSNGAETNIIQSHVDFWHHQCQKYQFMVNIDRYGVDKAIDLQKPRRLGRDTGTYYFEFGHLDKFQQYNEHLIKVSDLIIKEMDSMINDDTNPIVELKHAIEMLKRWKSRFLEKG